MLPLKTKHSFLVTGVWALKSTNAVYMNNISTYIQNMDIYFFKKKELHFLKKRTLHCALYSLLHFSKHKLTWILKFPSTPSDVNTMILYIRYLLVCLLAPDLNRLWIFYFFLLLLETKKRLYLDFPEYHCNHRAFSGMDGCWSKRGEWNHQVWHANRNIMIRPLIFCLFEKIFIIWWIIEYILHHRPKTETWNWKSLHLQLPPSHRVEAKPSRGFNLRCSRIF